MVNGGAESSVEVRGKRLALDIGGLISVARGRRDKWNSWRVTSLCEVRGRVVERNIRISHAMAYIFLFSVSSLFPITAVSLLTKGVSKSPVGFSGHSPPTHGMWFISWDAGPSLPWSLWRTASSGLCILRGSLWEWVVPIGSFLLFQRTRETAPNGQHYFWYLPICAQELSCPWCIQRTHYQPSAQKSLWSHPHQHSAEFLILQLTKALCCSPSTAGCEVRAKCGKELFPSPSSLAHTPFRGQPHLSCRIYLATHYRLRSLCGPSVPDMELERVFRCIIKGEYLHPFALFSKASHFARGHLPSPQLSPKPLVMLLLISSFTGKGLRKSHLCLFFVLVDCVNGEEVSLPSAWMGDTALLLSSVWLSFCPNVCYPS